MVALTAVFLFSIPELPARADSDSIRRAVQRALVPLQQGARGHIDQKTCFACHNQTYPLIAFHAARSRGIAVPEQLFRDQAEHILDFLESNRDHFLSGKGTGGQVDTAAAAMYALELANVKPNESTAAVVQYLLKTQSDQPNWRSTSNRPPTEASHFTATALAIRALHRFRTDESKAAADKRIQSAKGWLLANAPKDTEDRVFRLMGLKEVNASPRDLNLATFDLLNSQNRDGGWSQLPTLVSDPYATGTAMVILHRAGGLRTDHPAWQAGLRYLLQTQRRDGTWYVRSRSKPFQPYYESGFPFGTNQFIASSASSWAAAALALALPPKSN